MSALIASCEGQFIKAFPLLPGKRVYGLHEVFGLVSEEAASERMQSVKRKGSYGQHKKWLCRFHMEVNAGRPRIAAIDGCKVEFRENAWWIQTPHRTWKLATTLDGISLPAFPAEAASNSDDNKKITYALVALFLILMTGILMWSPAPVEEKVEEAPAPITVVVQKIKMTPVTQASPLPAVKPKDAKTHRAVQQNLGFLGLVGQKNLKKALGGAQVKLDASAGAGKGGSAGSGGEVLSGLGKGVRATTVGNTGVQGLGGVGTKGIGGGGGGYGDVAIASGEGRGISAIAVSQGVGVDGGLDRHVIQATIAKYLSQVRACYEDRLRVNPGLAGTLTMAFEIGASGKLNYANVKSSSVGDAAVGSCVSQKMMGWEFPKPRGGVNVKVNYPFDLRPVGR